MDLFKRVYTIEIGVPNKVDINNLKVLDNESAYTVYTRELPNNAILIDGREDPNALQFECKTNKKSDAGSKSDAFSLSIFNPSDNIINIASLPNSIIVIRAGYYSEVDDLPVIYSGNIVSTQHDTSGSDSKLTIIANDGYLSTSSAKVSVVFPKDYSVKKVITSLVGLIKGVSLGNINLESVKDKVVNSGYSFHGKAKKKLDEICYANGLQWYIDKGTIHIGPKNLSRDSADFSSYEKRMYRIYPKDVKDSIGLMSDNTKNISTESKNQTAIKLKLFLNGRISADSVIELVGHEDKYNGLYRITSVNHSLSFRGNDWTTTIESKRLG